MPSFILHPSIFYTCFVQDVSNILSGKTWTIDSFCWAKLMLSPRSRIWNSRCQGHGVWWWGITQNEKESILALQEKVGNLKNRENREKSENDLITEKTQGRSPIQTWMYKVFGLVMERDSEDWMHPSHFAFTALSSCPKLVTFHSY